MYCAVVEVEMRKESKDRAVSPENKNLVKNTSVVFLTMSFNRFLAHNADGMGAKLTVFSTICST